MGNYVFLDTQVFESYNFSVKNKYFQKLAEHINSGEISLAISSVVTKEINKHIKSHVKQLTNAIQANKIFYTIPGVENIEPILKNNKVLAAQIWGEIEKNLYQLGEEVALSHSNPEEVFDDYFSARFPFQGGKTEFPDAFVANSLLNWAKNNGHKVAIVSGNTKDWGKICERDEYKNSFAFYETLPALLDTITSIIAQERTMIKDCVQNSFINEFSKQFNDLVVTIDPDKLSWDDFSEPDVDYKSLNILKMDIDIIDYDNANNTAEISVSGLFSFKSHIDIDDIDCGIYDPEEKGFIGYWDRLRGTVEAKREFSCIVTVHKEGEEYKIDSLEIDSPRSIELSWGNCSEYYDDDNFIPDPVSMDDE